MKKEYIKPEVMVENAEPCNIMCVSAESIGLSVGGNASTNGITSADGRGRDIFVEEEEDLW